MTPRNERGGSVALRRPHGGSLLIPGRENFLQQNQDIGNTERLLEETRAWRMSFLLGRIEEFAGYEHQRGLRLARGGEEAPGRATAADVRAILREIQVAKKDVVETLGEEGQSLLDGFRAIHVQISSGKALGKKAAKAFFIVENKNGAAPKRIQV